jgi:hypothetical protein
MTQLIKVFSDDSFIEYDQGKFDKWSIYLTYPNQLRFEPKDLFCYSILAKVSEDFPARQLYDDFLYIYHKTTTQLDKAVLHDISLITAPYSPYDKEMDIWFSYLYASMVATENKRASILKKRSKRLAMHLLLIEGHTPLEVIRQIQSKHLHELNSAMHQRGF